METLCVWTTKRQLHNNNKLIIKTNKMTYEFTYKDNEGDEYEAGQYDTKAEAKQAWLEIRVHNQDDCRITETWCYDEDGDFQGRFKM